LTYSKPSNSFWWRRRRAVGEQLVDVGEVAVRGDLGLVGGREQALLQEAPVERLVEGVLAQLGEAVVRAQALLGQLLEEGLEERAGLDAEGARDADGLLEDDLEEVVLGVEVGVLGRVVAHLILDITCSIDA